MFGWRLVGTTVGELPAYGVKLELLSSGQWLDLSWGKRRWSLTRYSKNRHTSPAENRSVLDHFFGGPERRDKGSAFNHGFSVAKAKPVPSPFHNPYADECTCRICQASPAARALLNRTD